MVIKKIGSIKTGEARYGELYSYAFRQQMQQQAHIAVCLILFNIFCCLCFINEGNAWQK